MIHHISRSITVKRVSNGIFMFLLLVFVQVCLMVLMTDSSLDFPPPPPLLLIPLSVCSFWKKRFLFHTSMYFVILAFIPDDFSADFSHHMSSSVLQLSLLPILTPYGGSTVFACGYATWG